MKKFVILCLLLTGWGWNAWGGPTSGPEPLSGVRKSKVPVWLNLSVGGSVVHSYDEGTIPFPYLGFGGNAGLGATVEWKRCHAGNDLHVTAALLDNGGTSVGIDNRTEFLYRFHDSQRNRLHLWAGGALQSYFDIKEIPALMNASSGFSAFMNLCAEGMLSYDFAFIRDGSHNMLTLYGKLTLPLAGFAIRPGYAYLDNFTSDINLANTLLSDYTAFGKWFAGAGTEVGLRLNLLNGNCIGLEYRWDYLSTGRKGFYRFDNAVHSININFMFNIN